VTSSDSQQVTRVDPKSLKPTVVRVDGTPVGIAVGNGSVWVTDPEGDAVRSIDPDTRRVVRSWRTGPKPYALAVTRDGLLITDSDEHTIRRLEP
jgi:DNA-binding beta-propeller fold protein YncE